MAKKNQRAATTKQFVEIRDIKDGVVILKDGSFRSLLEVGSINFDLKSGDEQKAVISAFQNFLNAIDFPIQIVIHSRKLDIKPYIDSLGKRIEKLDNELLRIQAFEYSRFVSGLTELANIMSKKFYVVVPFYLVEASVSKRGVLETIKTLIKPSAAVKKLTEDQFKTYKNQLMQRVELVQGGLVGLGLRIKMLKNEELKNIFYNLYNG